MSGRSGLRATLSHLRLRIRVYARWLLHEVPKNPSYEVYARRMGLADRRAFFADRAADPAAVPDVYAPFGQDCVPKIIWMYWHQGEANAPFVVKCCIDSWRRHNPGWELRILDAESVSQYADISDVTDGLGFRFSADLLRVRLLKDHGGVWADATVYCHRPLDDWILLLTTTGFFALRNPGPGRWVSSWFLISTPGHILPTTWEAAYGPYLRELRYTPDLYFVFFYRFQWALRRNREAMAAWTRAPSLPAQPSLMMMQALQGNLTIERVQDAITRGTPISKLNWKIEIDEAEFDRLCVRLKGADTQRPVTPDAP
jgi:hypothetical protein